MHHGHKNKHCKKVECKPHKECKPEPCGKIVKYDCWEHEDPCCPKSSGQVRTVILKEYRFCEDKRECCERGYKTKQETPWECIPCENPRYCEKPGTKKCNDHSKRHH